MKREADAKPSDTSSEQSEAREDASYVEGSVKSAESCAPSKIATNGCDIEDDGFEEMKDAGQQSSDGPAVDEPTETESVDDLELLKQVSWIGTCVVGYGSSLRPADHRFYIILRVDSRICSFRQG